MKILFMGTPDIAATCLKALVEAGLEVVGAVSQPDKPKGRGHKLMPTDVKATAMDMNIPVFQPEALKNGELKPILEELKPDIIAVVAYGKILPKYILNYPRFGCVNMHASLLPKLRGAAPIQWSVINGDEKTGVTTMLMSEGLDTGDMLLQEETQIGEYETSEELFDRIAVMGGRILVETINKIEEITPVPQNHEEHTYAPMLSKNLAHIDWSKSTDSISKLICGMNSWPMAYAMYKGEPVKIVKAVKGGAVNGENGEIIGYFKDKGLQIKTADGSIFVQVAQFAGSKRMTVDEYLRGHDVQFGEILQ